MFELYNYRDATPDRRGQRLASPWIASVADKKEQAAHWSSAVRGYSFQLSDPDIQANRRYVLTAQFDLKGGRLFDQLVIEPESTGDKSAKHHERPTLHAPEETPSR